MPGINEPPLCIYSKIVFLRPFSFLDVLLLFLHFFFSCSFDTTLTKTDMVVSSTARKPRLNLILNKEKEKENRSVAAPHRHEK